MMESPTPEVRVSVSVRTLLVLLAFGVVVALALLSLGTLISILLAAVLAFGLDPVVGNLVRRGWKRGPASLTVFAGVFVAFVVLVVVTAGPVWEEIVEFVQRAAGDVGRAELQARVPGHPQHGQRRRHDRQPAQGARRRAAGRRERAARDRRRDLRLGPVARDAHVPRAVPADGAADDHDWLFGFATPDAEQRWHPVVENSIRAISTSLIGNLAISVVAATVAGVTACCWTCRSRSCWP